MKSPILEYLNAVARVHAGQEPGEAYYKWILGAGKLFTKKEDARRFHASFRKRFKGCYYNAQFMAMEYDKLKYYEGWGVTETVGIPLEHGFNVIDGRVVDVTWSDGIEYFGIEVPVEFAREEMLKETTAHPILFQWWRKVKKEE